MAQDALLKILLAAVRVDNGAVGVFSKRVNGEVAAQQILLQRDVRRGIAGKTGIPGT